MSPAGQANRIAGITPEIVLDQALDLLEEVGVEGFSMRKLAARLGVAPPTIYWHIGNKNELFDRLLDHITEQLGEITVSGRAPKQRVASIARGLRAEMGRHPQLVSLAYHQGRGATIYSRAQDALDRELAVAGLSTNRRRQAMADVLLHVGGFIVLDRALQTIEGQPGRVADRKELQASFTRILGAILDRHLREG